MLRFNAELGTSGPNRPSQGRQTRRLDRVRSHPRERRTRSVLPSFNAALNIRENLVARVAASRTLTRPDPSAMIPAVQFGDIGATNANVGNPALEPFISDNIDLGAEWYTGQEGYVAVAAFRKKIEGFTVNQTRPVPFPSLGIPFEILTPDQQRNLTARGGVNATVNLQQQVNADGLLTIEGYEVIWVQPLGQWFDALEGFGYNLNYTRVKQEGEAPRRRRRSRCFAAFVQRDALLREE